MPYDAIRHFINEQIGYGFSFGLDLRDRGRLYFACYLVVRTEWLGGEKHKPIYLLKDYVDRVAEYFTGKEYVQEYGEDDDHEDVRLWHTDDIYQSSPIFSGDIEWSGNIELGFGVSGLYFEDSEQAVEFGKLFKHLRRLAIEHVSGYPG